MKKEEAVIELISRGYIATLENGVVMVSMPITNKNLRDMEKLLRSIGYKASWGVRNV